MASNKYFVVKKLSDNTETLVGAPRAALAKLAVVGGKVQAKAANEEQIILHLQSGYRLHEKSREEGDGKMFLIGSVPPILVRAKNAGEAISLTDDSTDYEISQASHDTIVRLMTAGAQVLTYTEEPKAGAAPAPTGTAAGGATAAAVSEGGLQDSLTDPGRSDRDSGSAVNTSSDVNDAAPEAHTGSDAGSETSAVEGAADQAGDATTVAEPEATA